MWLYSFCGFIRSPANIILFLVLQTRRGWPLHFWFGMVWKVIFGHQSQFLSIYNLRPFPELNNIGSPINQRPILYLNWKGSQVVVLFHKEKEGKFCLQSQTLIELAILQLGHKPYHFDATPSKTLQPITRHQTCPICQSPPHWQFPIVCLTNIWAHLWLTIWYSKKTWKTPTIRATASK